MERRMREDLLAAGGGIREIIPHLHKSVLLPDQSESFHTDVRNDASLSRMALISGLDINVGQTFLSACSTGRLRQREWPRMAANGGMGRTSECLSRNRSGAKIDGVKRSQ